MTNIDEPLLLSVAEAAASLSIGRSKMYELIHEGEVRTARIGSRVLVPRSELVAYVRRMTDSPHAVDTPAL